MLFKRLQLSEEGLIVFRNWTAVEMLYDLFEIPNLNVTYTNTLHAFLTWVKSWSVKRCNSRGLKQF